MARKPKIDRFNEKILSRFQIYNSLFLTLPFENIKKTSLLLPLFADHCQNQFQLKKNPNEIVVSFFERFAPEFNIDEQQDLLFNFIQYIERQVVLFDAIEDAGFSYVNNMHGRGTLRNIKEEAHKKRLSNSLIDYIKRFKVRIVLTAHPTQFYPDNVLVIINELSNAIAHDDLDRIQKLLVQLGKTPFYKKENPTRNTRDPLFGHLRLPHMPTAGPRRMRPRARRRRPPALSRDAGRRQRVPDERQVRL